MKRGNEEWKVQPGTAGGCFNGAALHEARKLVGDLPPLIKAEGASTGPRFMKRGNIVSVSEYARRKRSFNGAALHEARKFAGAVQTHQRTGCFNGAALHEARKSLRYIRVDKEWLASTGPRFMKRGNWRPHGRF